jgi:hypothetical protein
VAERVLLTLRLENAVICLTAGKLDDYLIGTVLRRLFAYLVCEDRFSFLPRVIRIATRRCGYCRDDYAVAVNIHHT